MEVRCLNGNLDRGPPGSQRPPRAPCSPDRPPGEAGGTDVTWNAAQGPADGARVCPPASTAPARLRRPRGAAKRRRQAPRCEPDHRSSPHMTWLTTPDGIRLHYEIEGDGPPLVLHLGAGCDSELWRAAGYLEPLAKSYRCVLFDHRGHGRSDRPRGAEANHINRYVGDVVALLDHLGLERVAFWGYSNGGTVGLKVAQEHPNRISALVGSDGISHTTPKQIAEIVARRVPEFREYGWTKLIE